MKHAGGSQQGELFGRSKKPSITIEDNHPLVMLTDQLDWTELERLVEGIRRKKLKGPAGRTPHLRATIGAVILQARRKLTYRELEDQIRHYAPARYLCGLTESDWTPDFTTLQDFVELLGEDGIRQINEHVVKLAVAEKLADPKLLVADTTAQEAAIPWPNEMGLMATFMAAVAAASTKAGGALKAMAEKVADTFKKAKEKVRRYRLFAKTKEKKSKLITEMATLVDAVRRKLGLALIAASSAGKRLRGYGKLAHTKLDHLHVTMSKLLPQIRYWVRTGRVATNKIINLHIPELYAIVRGKLGKAVEFGLRWGISRLGGGYLLAAVAKHPKELYDHRYALRAVEDHMALFGKAPRSYAYDRGGYSSSNVGTLKELGVKHVGLAPLGKAKWSVTGRIKDRLIKERTQVEAGIGAIKSNRYGFNRPNARSASMMGAYGQRAVLGFNLSKLIRDIAKRQEIELATC